MFQRTIFIAVVVNAFGPATSRKDFAHWSWMYPDELELFTPTADARRRPWAVFFMLYKVCTIST